MRLIDANEIAEKLYELHQETICTHEPFLAGKADAYWDAHGMVIEARTIDAIPIEWMKKMLEKMNHAAEPHFAFFYVLREWENTKSIEQLQAESEMRDWQKEQEDNVNETNRCRCRYQDHGENES